MRRATETRLRRTFADVLTAVLATAGAVGCGGSTTTTTNQGPGGGGGGPTPELTSLCTTDSPAQRSLLQGLRASPELDGAVSRNESAFARAGGNNPGVVTPPSEELGDAWTGTNGEQVGTLCAKATDADACRAKVAGFRILPTTREACIAQYPGSSYSPNLCGASYILYTRGDEIGVARTNDEIKALIGTFDTLGEAMWVATNAGLQTSCSTGTGADALPRSEYRTTQDGGWDLSLLDAKNCGDATYKVLVHIDYAGNLTEVSRENLNQKPSCAVAGRRPEGLVLAELASLGAGSREAVGQYFASMTVLEAASVTAFRRLHRQLASFGAPPELLARIRKAARDEIRHARATGTLARKYGVKPTAPEIGACDASPSLFAIALENAREGCIRETFGALVAHLQTTRAADPEVRACMAAIADEETEHAALSWDIAAWIEAQLGADDRATLASERRDAFATLARELALPVDAHVAHVSGIPSAADALRMLDGLAPMMLAA
jgi:hypothetical protein